MSRKPASLIGRGKEVAILNREAKFTVKFWGVRGSIPCPGLAYHRYGGNTPCVEMTCGDKTLIFDAGTGLRSLGQELVKKGKIEAEIFFSHAHLDHIIGFPFFAPAFHPKNKFKIWSAVFDQQIPIKEVFKKLTSSPMFPVSFEIFNAQFDFLTFKPGDEIDVDEKISLSTVELNHPQGAVGYRVNFAGKSVCYITDTEHKPGIIDQNIKSLVRGADVVIYDACFTDENYANYIGWGHSTWQEGVKLCDAASVKKLIIFHHDPGNDDSAMDIISKNVEKARPGSLVAMEGMELEV